MNRLLCLFSLVALFGCQTPPPPAAAPLPWRGVLLLSDSVSLPFEFTWQPETDTPMWILNGSERIPVPDLDIKTKGDSFLIDLPVFESFLLVNQGKDGWTGVWADESRGPAYRIPFRARPAARGRFFDEAATIQPEPLAARWAVRFSPGTADEYPAVGLFEAKGDTLTGTFLTETGDYRYLAGQLRGDSLWLSAFDGSHAFLFTARIQGDSLAGQFYSGNHWQEPWVAVADSAASLRDANTLTFLKPGETLEFAFPDLRGDTLRFPSAETEGKVVLIQLLGSWCPNCMDETRLLAEWHDTYGPRGLEIMGLAFERRQDLAAAQEAVRSMARRLEADYPMAIASLSASKTAAAEKLPALSTVLAFPTTILLDRRGQVQRVHTGFSGPGTGEAYVAFRKEYEALLEKLLEEGE